MTSDTVDALAIRNTGVGQYVDEIYYSLQKGGVSWLYRGRTSGNASFDTNDTRFSLKGQIIGTGVTGLTTGLQFRQDGWSSSTLYGVSSAGEFFSVNTGTGTATLLVDFSSTSLLTNKLNVGEGFAGLATAPK